MAVATATAAVVAAPLLVPLVVFVVAVANHRRHACAHVHVYAITC